MNSQEVCEGLAKHYDFNIPEAVVKTQLVSLYKKDLNPLYRRELFK